MFTKWFYGNEISEYGQKNKRVDYATFAKAFDGVLANSLMTQTEGVIGYWEMESGFVDNSDEIEELNEEKEELEAKLDTTLNEDEAEEIRDRILEIEDEIDDLENDTDIPEVFQWYIVDEEGARICKEFNEILYYNEELDLYLWGVDHFGTSWSYVLTNIPCEPERAGE